MVCQVRYSHCRLTDKEQHIETAKTVSGEKVIIVGHSMGSQVAHYFFKWVEAEGYGNGGPRWVEDHIGNT